MKKINFNYEIWKEKPSIEKSKFDDISYFLTSPKLDSEIFLTISYCEDMSEIGRKENKIEYRGLTGWKTFEMCEWTRAAAMCECPKIASYSNVSFGNGYRKRENICSINFLIYDFDHDISLENVSDFLKIQDFKSLISTTSRHDPQGENKFRLIIPITQPIYEKLTNAEYRAISSHILEILKNNEMFEKYDKNALNLGQMFYTSQLSEHKQSLYFGSDKGILDTSKILEFLEFYKKEKEKEKKEVVADVQMVGNHHQPTQIKVNSQHMGVSDALILLDFERLNSDYDIEYLISRFEPHLKKDAGGTWRGEGAAYIRCENDNAVVNMNDSEGKRISYTPAQYLRKQLKCATWRDLGNILLRVYGKDYLTLNYEKIKMAVEKALKNENVKNDKTFNDFLCVELGLEKRKGKDKTGKEVMISPIKLDGMGFRIFKFNISFRELGFSKKEIIENFKSKRGGK
ncbi:hypothetical protein O6B99_07465 [Campylobacter ureolyticus]|uniref:Uncharacterized protein n=2 Tax=Campylobacter ureolyticus TaxID=827 RepID=A0A9Q4PXR8_9BACT|nr:hypothetical protein [Campylobacter ureolyticus]MCZ6162235.1 hypothetical protein [Campylobacter ureolyticus]MCZ6171143.1 hypothetical protein [Campylobacter ureolyticus]MCZ6172260.1 hypothetical protein [Campylobacter ureolyticus]